MSGCPRSNIPFDSIATCSFTPALTKPGTIVNISITCKKNKMAHCRYYSYRKTSTNIVSPRNIGDLFLNHCLLFSIKKKSPTENSKYHTSYGCKYSSLSNSINVKTACIDTISTYYNDTYTYNLLHYLGDSSWQHSPITLIKTA